MEKNFVIKLNNGFYFIEDGMEGLQYSMNIEDAHRMNQSDAQFLCDFLGGTVEEINKPK